ncbi:MAG: hypothetical protein KBI01_03320 [Oscillospiraceae bacterium]|nr:hypothetical protein [Oscillospiraceae bacterium]
MRKRILFVCVAIAIIAAIVILIKAIGSTDNPHAITIPSPAAESGGYIGDDGVNRVEVNPETVKVVLGTLSRAESFSRTYTVKNYWNGGESEDTLSYWQKGSNIRINIKRNNTVRNILVLENDLYVWYDGSSGVLKSTLSKSDVAREVDMFSGLVTYEDIKEIPQEDILNAGYTEHSGQACIYCEYKSGELNYVKRLYVSNDTGLLVSLEKYDGDTLIYSMESVSIELSTPSDNIFQIPS